MARNDATYAQTNFAESLAVKAGFVDLNAAAVAAGFSHYLDKFDMSALIERLKGGLVPDLTPPTIADGGITPVEAVALLGKRVEVTADGWNAKTGGPWGNVTTWTIDVTGVVLYAESGLPCLTGERVDKTVSQPVTRHLHLIQAWKIVGK